MAHGTQDLKGLLADGQLDAATQRLLEHVRGSPADAAARTTLAELMLLAGAFEKAEAQLAIVAQQTVDRPVALARMRHLIRAAVAREAWYTQAAVPALLDAPSPAQRAAMNMALAVHAGDAGAASAALEEAEAARPHVTGTADGVAFDDMRDVDDRCACFFDILTHDGNYMWTDLSAVESITFSPPQRPIDLLWRETRLRFRNGQEADIVVPAQYVSANPTEAHRLALETAWNEGVGGVCDGAGQRLFLVGSDAKPILEMTEIRFDQPPG